MTPVYERNGIRFFYPEGWSIIDEHPEEGIASVTVQSASSAFWSVSAYDQPIAPLELLEQTLDTMQQEFEGLESDAITAPLGPQGATGYEMQFFYLDLVITARALAWRQGGRSLLILYQAESREFDELERVFAAINTSLARELDG